MGIANIINNSTTTSGGEIVRELVNASDGQGLHFNGSGYVSAGDTTVIDGATKLSVEVIAATTAADDGEMVAKAHAATALRFYVNTSGQVVFRVNNGSSNGTATSSGTVNDGNPTHIVGVWDGSTVKIYINGNEDGSAALSGGAVPNIADKLALGTQLSSSDSTANSFTGTLYRARLWNKAVDAKALFERADVDFADQYGSETKLNSSTCVNATSSNAFNTFSGASATGFTAISTGAGSSSQFAATADEISFVKGKKYSITFDATLNSGTAPKWNAAISILSATGTTDHSIATVTAGANGGIFTANQTTTGVISFKSEGGAATNFAISNLKVVRCGVVSDYDLAFASPTQSLTVQDRAGAADGTCSASGVTQVQPVVQLNSTSARIGTSAATPGDGELMVSGNVSTRDDYYYQFGGNNARITGSHSGNYVKLLTSNALAVTVDGSGNVKIGSDSAANTQLSVECDTTGEAIGDGIRVQNAHGVNADIAPMYFGVHGGTRRAKAAIGLKRTGSYGIGELRFAVDSNSTDTDVSFATDTKLTISSTGTAIISKPQQTTTGTPFSGAALKLWPSDTTNSTGVSSIALSTSTVDNYGFLISGHRTGTDGSPTLRISSHNNSNTGNERLTINSAGVCTFNVGINLGHENLTKYDEGSFTPTIGAETGTINGTNIVGRYTRIGNVCHVWFSIECTGVSGASGAVEFGNFPFTTSSIASDYNTPMVVRYVSLGSAVESLVLRLFNSSTGGRIEEQNGTSVTNLADNVQNGTIFQVAGAYRLTSG